MAAVPGRAFRPLARPAVAGLHACGSHRATSCWSIGLHHIVADGWSLGVFAQELASSTRRWRRPGPPLPELAVQYGDFATWQRAWLAGEVLRGSSTTGASGSPTCPSWSYRSIAAPARPSCTGEQTSLPRAGAAGRETRAVGRERGATLFMVLLAAFDVVLRAGRPGRHRRRARRSPTATAPRPRG